MSSGVLSGDVPLTHHESYLAEDDADRLLHELSTGTSWSTAPGSGPGALDRAVHWIGGRTYDFYGTTIPTHPWTTALTHLRLALERETDARYNSVLLNLYRDGRDCIGWHSDDESALGPEPTIASLSLGSTRTFAMRHLASGREVRLPLTHGSLVVMHGESQSAWQHAVPATDDPVGPRLNLTFRWWH